LATIEATESLNFLVDMPEAMTNTNGFAVAVHRRGRGAPLLQSGNLQAEADVNVWRDVNFRSHLRVLGSTLVV
jgi:hypothetical protein